MQPIEWFLLIAGIIASIAAVLALAASIKRRSESVAPLFQISEGRFSRLAAIRLGSPDALLNLCRAKEPNKATKGFGASKIASKDEADISSSSPEIVAMWGAAAADGITPALDVWSRWASVDDHVFQAFTHLSHNQIDGVADLLNLVDAKGYALESAQFANKLLGHVGEWHVQEHMIQAGVNVAMPVGTNEPGLDMWVDGHALNVKTVADAGAAASSHFADYPDIPIVVPIDAAHIPADALHFDPRTGLDTAALTGSDHLTIVDETFSHAEMLGQTHNAIDVLNHPGPHLHIPWVTMAVSGFREGRLLVKGNTDLLRASKNVVVDTVGVGGGGVLGMKTGAAIGSFFGPVGAVVGSLAGGIAGALGGRAAASAVKRLPLKDAQQAYKKALAKYHRKEQQLTQAADRNWRTAQQREMFVLRRYAEAEERTHQQLINRLHHRLAKIVKLDANAAKTYMNTALSRIETVLVEDQARLLKSVPRWAFPWAGLVAPRDAQILVKHSKEAIAWRKSATRLMNNWTEDPKNTARCFDLILASPGGKAEAEKYLEALKYTRGSAIAEAGASGQKTLASVVAQRTKAVARLRDKWEEIRTQIEAEIVPVIELLKTSAKAYRSELRKAGVDL